MATTAVVTQEKRTTPHLSLRLAVGIVLAVAVVWGAWSFWATRRYRSALATADAAMAAGRFGLASRELNQILAWKPNADEAAYALGVCEQTRGKHDAAEQAWARIGPGSAFEQRAFLARLRLFHDTGRLAAAENLVITAAQDPRYDATHLRSLLVPIHSQTGRSDEAERLIEERWLHLAATDQATLEQSIKLLRTHIELTFTASTVQNLRLYLDQMGRLAPDDDRVWLGRANLAIRLGAFDEAKKWLDLCQQRRPRDVPVWKAWLNWGMATHRPRLVETAQEYLPGDAIKPAAKHRLQAWFCSQRGDNAAERAELERLIAADPSDLEALDRLTKLAGARGRPAEVAELDQKRAEIDRLMARYKQLYERNQHVRDAEEMARLAEALGRTFEARVLLSLAITEEPERSDLERQLARLSRD